MDIILLKDVDKVGYKHDLVSVKNGFGRNYLIPKRLAVIANDSNRKRLAELKKQAENKILKNLEQYKELAAKLDGVSLKIGAKTGTTGKIFGSVTNFQIGEALKEQFDVEIERKRITIEGDEIKTLGEYVATLDFHPEVQAKVNFEVVAE